MNFDSRYAFILRGSYLRPDPTSRLKLHLELHKFARERILTGDGISPSYQSPDRLPRTLCQAKEIAFTKKACATESRTCYLLHAFSGSTSLSQCHGRPGGNAAESPPCQYHKRIRND
ncbi:hypothetical protein DOTSEDRAFT_36108 [Dothistroma septosporum NZE10]|uniref:Uncharacterized protein n=1 Tax=Dothistroma septosporum (strain NZE10 / CBS 128990) TaxID=675120 RepID=N1PJB2_DOTSN|nr:hypothetical protein DOTSEDRAFT_36108 [Dothistroma septosporum NZE10]